MTAELAITDPDADTSRTMIPLRPTWVGDGVVIPGEKLFENLRGLLTYGSPLDKFATLWPAIVPQNKDTLATANSKFEWINVYDPMDSISGSLEFFESRSPQAPTKPVNLPYAASIWFLLAHIAYLKPIGGGLAERLVDWVKTGEPFDQSEKPGLWLSPDEAGRRRIVKYAFWVGLTVLLAFLLAWAAPLFFEALSSLFSECPADACVEKDWPEQVTGWLDWLSATMDGIVVRAGAALVVTYLLVFLLGVVRKWRQKGRAKRFGQSG